jgi:hypothetical protein
VDLLRAQAAGLALEQREHLLARSAGAVAGAGELAAGVLAPGVVGMRGAHGTYLSASENGLQ